MACGASVHTEVPFNITATSAMTGGYNISTTNAIVTKGIAYSTSPTPVVGGTHVTAVPATLGLPFEVALTGLLTASTTYYVRAYVDNGCTVAYGEEWSFRTLAADASTNKCIVKTVTITEGETYVVPIGAQIINASNLASVKSTCNLDLPIQAYESVKIGDQVWMKKNLDITTYRNGDPITYIEDPDEWKGTTEGAWCVYENDSCNEKQYGILYNWYAVHDPRGIAPLGWHLPTQAEYQTLSTTLGGNDISGGKMKSTKYWSAPNAGATNSSGWSGFPSGRRNGSPSESAQFEYIGAFGWWWFNDVSFGGDVISVSLRYDIDDFAFAPASDKQTGYSVRCIKD